MHAHGRASGWCAAAGALIFAISASGQVAERPTSVPDLARELATKILGAVAPAKEIRLSLVDDVPQSAVVSATLRQCERELVSVLAAAGVRIVEQTSAAVAVALRCGENLRDRVCTADVRKGEAQEIIMAARPRTSVDDPVGANALATLEMRPLLAERLPILDLVVLDERLLVLDVASLALYERGDSGWAPRASQLLPSGTRSRDVRGRVIAGGDRLEVFLPGFACRGTLDPFTIDCAESQGPWPIGIENAGIVSGRNYFAATRVPPFFGAVTLGTRAGARWLLSSLDGSLLFVDDSFRVLSSVSGWGDDIAGLTTRCGSGRQVILSVRDERAAGLDTDRRTDMLGAFEVIDRLLIPVTPPAVLPGSLSALWSAPDANSAVAVARNPDTERYEAFELRLSCAR